MSEAIPTRLLKLDEEGLLQAVEVLGHGGLVAFPTETVYGLGADATNDRAVARIFEAKGRPHFNPLICHYPDAEAITSSVLVDRRAEALAAAFWPGALTLVLPRSAACPVSLLCSAGMSSLAVRVPALQSARDLLSAFGRPIAAPSANRSGKVSPTRAEHVVQELAGRIELLLDGGPCSVGVESTVLSLLDERPLLLRPGGITAEAIAEVLGEMPRSPDKETAITAPGMLTSHYAPDSHLRLNVTALEPGEALLSFGPASIQGAVIEMNLSPSGDLQEAAARLFAALRRLDRSGAKAIAVMPIPEEGLGRAINDRLRRAAAPRSSLPSDLG